MAVNAYDLVTEKYDIALFIEEHGSEPSYRQKLTGLHGRYCAVRKTSADGSCFYRALGFASLESSLGKPQHILRFRETVTQSRLLLATGFPDRVFRHHYNTFLSLIDAAENDRWGRNLLRAFNNPEVSDSAVRYLRLVTSAFLRSRADFYQPFIEDEKCIEDFCAENVEPMTAVSDHIQIMALTQALEIPLQVEYMDSMDAAINQHNFPEGSSPGVYMLYEQNHYTLLYRGAEV